jgi:hypothetical protein
LSSYSWQFSVQWNRFGADGDARDGRNTIMMIFDDENRGLFYRDLRLTSQRNQEQLRLVNKDEVGRKPCDVLLRGLTDRFYSAMPFRCAQWSSVPFFGGSNLFGGGVYLRDYGGIPLSVSVRSA